MYYKSNRRKRIRAQTSDTWLKSHNKDHDYCDSLSGVTVIRDIFYVLYLNWLHSFLMRMLLKFIALALAYLKIQLGLVYNIHEKRIIYDIHYCGLK